MLSGGGGLATGGVDDRFDFQLVTAEMQDGDGMSYIGPSVPNTLISPAQNSYHAFGNNGSTFNNASNAAANSALPASEYSPGPGEPTRLDALNGLTSASDHLPLVADFQLPARMGASIGVYPTQVIKNSAATLEVQVANIAPVAVAIGADELQYTYGGTGGMSGSGGETTGLLALNPAASHSLSLDTATLGPQTAR